MMEQVTNNEFKGNGNGSTSHYRIKSKITVQLMSSVEGNRACEKTDYLMCQIGYRHAFIAAYLKGNGYVKLFTLHDYIDWQFNERIARSVDITQEEYDDDEAFSRIIERNFSILRGQAV